MLNLITRRTGTHENADDHGNTLFFVPFQNESEFHPAVFCLAQFSRAVLSALSSDVQQSLSVLGLRYSR